eukprot:TRINITY_DN484_c0_g5_i1.p2 TRINITY_DN484_c0_g5~~TRINITY_DN484_c0_g5_i1.p2  ORF type:complete len:100 (+),score=5.98 TRINITY_DN484_c0_g5_i1:196-495(+)
MNKHTNTNTQTLPDINQPNPTLTSFEWLSTVYTTTRLAINMIICMINSTNNNTFVRQHVIIHRSSLSPYGRHSLAHNGTTQPPTQRNIIHSNCQIIAIM